MIEPASEGSDPRVADALTERGMEPRAGEHPTGLSCCDQSCAHALVRNGLLRAGASVGIGRRYAVLTPLGEAALATPAAA